MPIAMTAHIKFTSISDRPVTISEKAIKMIRSIIGFGGLIITDDIQIYIYKPLTKSTNFHDLLEKPKIYLTFNGFMEISLINSPEFLNIFSLYLNSAKATILDEVCDFKTISFICELISL